MKCLLALTVLLVAVYVSESCLTAFECRGGSTCSDGSHPVCHNRRCSCVTDHSCTSESDCTDRCQPLGKEHCIGGLCHCILGDLIGK